MSIVPRTLQYRDSPLFRPESHFCSKITQHKMATLKIVSWNCRGLHRDSPQNFNKMFFLEKQYPTHEFDILTLLETHHTKKEDLSDMITEYNLHHQIFDSPAPASDPYSGIIVALNNDFKVLKMDILLPGRIITINFEHNITHEQYHLTLYYGVHPHNTSIDQLGKVFSTLTTDHTLKTNSIIIGDFNFVNDDLDRTHGMNAWDKKTVKQWNPIQTKFLWSDPFRHLYPKRRLYSFQGTHGLQYRSRIDRMYVSQHNIGNVIKYTYIPFLDPF